MDSEEHRLNLALQLEPRKAASSSSPAVKRIGDESRGVTAGGPQKRQATAMAETTAAARTYPPFRVPRPPPRAPAAPAAPRGRLKDRLGSSTSPNSGVLVTPRPKCGPTTVPPRPSLASPDPAARQVDVALGLPGSSEALKPQIVQHRHQASTPGLVSQQTASQRRSDVEEEAASSAQSTAVPASQGEVFSQSTSRETSALSQETTEWHLATTPKGEWTGKDFLDALKTGYLETLAQFIGNIGMHGHRWDLEQSRSVVKDFLERYNHIDSHDCSLHYFEHQREGSHFRATLVTTGFGNRRYVGSSADYPKSVKHPRGSKDRQIMRTRSAERMACAAFMADTDVDEIRQHLPPPRRIIRRHMHLTQPQKEELKVLCGNGFQAVHDQIIDAVYQGFSRLGCRTAAWDAQQGIQISALPKETS
ncbi:unnamed protein product [Symbiodinium sp. CCMP2592]|nr:unnamed protein product [Symbiodinium sp. CCMP2592]